MVRLAKKADGETLRSYTGAGGVLVPSVTEVLKVLEGDWMNAWLQRAGRREVDRCMKEAGVLGTRIHAVAASLAENRKAKVPADMRLYARGIGEFLDQHVRRVLHTELSLCSERLGFGGTMDLVCELQDGTLAVADYKSSSGGVTKIHKLQTAAYAMLLREHGIQVHKRLVVRIHKADDKRGEWYVRAALSHREDVETFQACVIVWRFLHGHKLKALSNKEVVR